jgi:histidinol dehydrogenase
MTAIPAQVAGVDEIYLASPAATDGNVAPSKLVAADIAGVKAVYKAGGAQAIAALAYGTETIPRVDKICGPGNIWVTLAKRRVYGVTGIDNLFGPTETVVLADDSASPIFCAADLIAQAEHDELASPILLTTSRALAEAVAVEIDEQLRTLPRGYVARAAIESRGAVVVETLEEAVTLANEFAPEHLCLLVREPRALLPLIRNAGGVFIGDGTPEAIGDYTAGPSHVMPTGGSARYASPLNVADFLKIMSLVELPPSVVSAIGPAAARIGYAEGLAGHARAVEHRLQAM